MNAYASPHNPEDSFSQRMEEMMSSVEFEIRHAVEYVDAEIVPKVRREAGILARVLSGHLDQIAEKLHPQTEPNRKQG